MAPRLPKTRSRTAGPDYPEHAEDGQRHCERIQPVVLEVFGAIGAQPEPQRELHSKECPDPETDPLHIRVPRRLERLGGFDHQHQHHGGEQEGEAEPAIQPFPQILPLVPAQHGCVASILHDGRNLVLSRVDGAFHPEHLNHGPDQDDQRKGKQDSEKAEEPAK